MNALEENAVNGFSRLQWLEIRHERALVQIHIQFQERGCPGSLFSVRSEMPEYGLRTTK
jgi:hypothetical protein